MTVRDWASAKRAGLLFLPYVHKYAARLEQVEIRQMLSDPGTMTRCLRDAQRLFGYDGVINSFDVTLESEACGCGVDWSSGLPDVVLHAACVHSLDGVNGRFENSGRLPAVLEATKRLRAEVGGSTSLVGGVTGPVTLAAQLLGPSFPEELVSNSLLAQDLLEFAGDVCLTLCRRYCEAGVDGILIVEDTSVAHVPPTTLASGSRPLLQTLRNLTRHFGVPLILAARSTAGITDFQALCSLPVDALSVGSVASLLGTTTLGPPSSPVLGASIPSSAFAGPGDQAAEAVMEAMRRIGSSAYFLTSEWEVPVEAVPGSFHQIVKAIAQHCVQRRQGC